MLLVHRAERADALVDALGALLAAPPDDPFAREVVAVPTRGMERWLTQRLSTQLGTASGRADGVCANVAFPSPRRLVGDAVAAASGIDAETDPWLAERIVWPLLEVIEDALTQPWLRVLATHLGAAPDAPDEARRARRLSSVRHIAELFDRYARQRPQMVRGWCSGDDGYGDGRDLPPDALWQPRLWRLLRDRVPAPDPATRLDPACRRLRDEPGLVDLPERLSLFGLTRLEAATLQVLAALAAGRDVHLFVLHPSPALWHRVEQALAGEAVAGMGEAVVAGAAGRARHGGAAPIARRDDDATKYLATNRLLASWGQDSRELQLVLTTATGHTDHHHHPIERLAEATLLERIQADVRADRAPQPADRAPLDPEDRSIQVHACHGRSRQVEVLRGAILHVLEEDPTLEPRDVIVMCPDIETFAPLIQATFGAGQIGGEEADPLPDDVRPPDLRVRLADRSLRQTNQILGVVAALLELAGGRVTASEVLDLADRPPVRRRFGFDDDDLSRIEDWVAGSGIRWGLDAEHRRPFKLDKLGAGTWRAGLDRVLLGVTMSETLLGGVLALDDVESGAIDLAGRLAELVDRLAAALDALTTPQPICGWAASLAAAADALTATMPADAWQRAELQRLLDKVVDGATAARGGELGRAAGGGVAAGGGAAAGGGDEVNTTLLALPEVRALLAERLAGRPTRANFRTGHLTVCTLMPMRSVPHRVVCLLGLDDGAFPRRTARDGDDLVLDDPHVGDRDPRAEDRQLLLDALLAATDRLVITYTGNDERTNIERPPAVPVGELLDTIDATASPDTAGGTARERVLVRHPLQPFDPRDFVPVQHAGGKPWSFDRVTLEGARVLSADRPPPAPFLAGPLPAVNAGVVELDDLVRFVEHPVKAFLRQRLDVRVGRYADEISDVLPVELDGLGQWGVGDRLLQLMLTGVPLDEARAIEEARGMLPPGELARPVLDKLVPIVEQILRAARTLSPDAFTSAPLDVDVDLGEGRRLTGVVQGVGAGVMRTVAFSRVKPNARLAAWVRLLALVAADPGRPYEALTIGRAQPDAQNARITVAHIPSLSDDAGERARLARRHLATIVELRDRGLREPLPIATLSSAAYARAAQRGKDGAGAARKQWESAWKFDGEDAQPEHQLVYGGVLAFEALLAQRPRADETGAGWDEREATRFGRYARRLWDWRAEHERVSDR